MSPNHIYKYGVNRLYREPEDCLWPHKDQCEAFTARGGNVTMQQYDCFALPLTWKPHGKTQVYSEP